MQEEEVSLRREDALAFAVWDKWKSRSTVRVQMSSLSGKQVEQLCVETDADKLATSSYQQRQRACNTAWLDAMAPCHDLRETSEVGCRCFGAKTTGCVIIYFMLH